MSGTYEQQGKETEGTLGGAKVGDPLTPTHDPNRSATSKAKGKGSGLVASRLPRVDRPVVIPRFMLGGILNQMISDARDRLVEMKECVLWYEREVTRCERRVAELEALASSVTTFDVDVDESDELDDEQE